jgi:hypothetical protein
MHRPIKRRRPHPHLLGYLTTYDRTIADLALALREIILEEAPDASESIYQVYTVAVWFGFSGKMKDMFCYITTNARHINLGFPQGATLPDPNRLLEGEGKAMRHIKFRSMSDLERPFVRRYIRAAIEQVGAAAAAGGTGKSVVKRKAGEMAANKTKPTKLSVAAYIDALTDEARRSDAKALVKLMQSATGEKPKMWGPSIIGFGSYHYTYESGREGDMPLAGFSPRKAATVLYGITGFRGAEVLLAKLGKHTTGKGCLYTKKLADVDLEVLESLVVKAVAAKRSRQAG